VQVIPPEVCEAVRLMMARMRLADGTDVPQRLGIISSLAGEGTTTVARSLAVVLSNDLSRQVCLVELNWWSLSPWSNDSEARGGLAEVIAAGAPLDAVLVPTGNPGLTVLPAGATAVSERPLLANSLELEKILLELSERYDHVLLDLPALATTSDALTLAEKAGMLVLVVRHGVTGEADIESAVEQLRGLPVLGSIINRYSTKLPGFVKRRLPGS
jgi:Mrp family chromosome partitioning ATPase